MQLVLHDPAGEGAPGERRFRAFAEMASDREESYRRLVELAPAVVVHVDGRLTFVNQRAVELLGGRGPDQLIGRPIMQFILDQDRPEFEARPRQTGRPGASVPPLARRLRRLDGRPIDTEIRSVAFVQGGRPAVLAVIRDITERKRAEAKIWHLAHHDPLTGLANRVLFAVSAWSGPWPACGAAASRSRSWPST